MIFPSPSVSPGFPSLPSQPLLPSECSRSASGPSATSFEPSTNDAGRQAISDLVNLLHEHERLVDLAISTGGRLNDALVQARLQNDLSAVVGQRAFMAFSQASLHLSTARGHTVDGHRVLEKVAAALDIRAEDFGDGRKDPSVWDVPGTGA